MDETEDTFPMDFYVRDPSPRPWKFRPEGYLVVILSDADEAQRAEADLVTHGFAPPDIKLYTGKQILENYEMYAARRNTTDKLVGSVVDDSEGRELYQRCGYASQTKRTSRKLCESSPTATTFIGATTAPSGRPTSR
jgi:hypothetical protein